MRSGDAVRPTDVAQPHGVGESADSPQGARSLDLCAAARVDDALARRRRGTSAERPPMPRCACTDPSAMTSYVVAPVSACIERSCLQTAHFLCIKSESPKVNSDAIWRIFPNDGSAEIPGSTHILQFSHVPVALPMSWSQRRRCLGQHRAMADPTLVCGRHTCFAHAAVAQLQRGAGASREGSHDESDLQRRNGHSRMPSISQPDRGHAK